MESDGNSQAGGRARKRAGWGGRLRQEATELRTQVEQKAADGSRADEDEDDGEDDEWDERPQEPGAGVHYLVPVQVESTRPV